MDCWIQIFAIPNNGFFIYSFSHRKIKLSSFRCLEKKLVFNITFHFIVVIALKWPIYCLFGNFISIYCHQFDVVVTSKNSYKNLWHPLELVLYIVLMLIGNDLIRIGNWKSRHHTKSIVKMKSIVLITKKKHLPHMQYIYSCLTFFLR